MAADLRNKLRPKPRADITFPVTFEADSPDADSVFVTDNEVEKLRNSFSIPDTFGLLSAPDYELLSGFVCTAGFEGEPPPNMARYLFLDKNTTWDEEWGPMHEGGLFARKYDGLWFLVHGGGMGYSPGILSIDGGTREQVKELVEKIKSLPDMTASYWSCWSDKTESTWTREGVKGHHLYHTLAEVTTKSEDSTNRFEWKVTLEGCHHATAKGTTESLAKATAVCDELLLDHGWNLLHRSPMVGLGS